MKKIKSLIELVWALLGLLIGRCPKSPPSGECPLR